MTILGFSLIQGKLYMATKTLLTHIYKAHMRCLGLSSTHGSVFHSLSTVLTFCNHYHFNLELLLLRLKLLFIDFLETVQPVSLSSESLYKDIFLIRNQKEIVSAKGL